VLACSYRQSCECPQGLTVIVGHLPSATTLGPVSTILCSLVAAFGNQHIDSSVLGMRSFTWANKSAFVFCWKRQNMCKVHIEFKISQTSVINPGDIFLTLREVNPTKELETKVGHKSVVIH